MSEEGMGHCPGRPGMDDESRSQSGAGVSTAVNNGSTSSAGGTSSASRIVQMRRTSQLIVPDISGDVTDTRRRWLAPTNLGLASRSDKTSEDVFASSPQTACKSSCAVGLP